MLLNDRFAPLTSDLGFVRSDAETVTSGLVSWWTGLAHIGRVVTDELAGSLGDLVSALEPLDTVMARRHLVLPTDGPWSAVLTNNWQGSGAGSIVSVLAEDLAVNGLRAMAAEDRSDAVPPGPYGGTAFELYGPEGRDPGGYIRTIWAINDGGAWDFGTTGAVQAFEQPDYYSRRRVRDRFPRELLEAYCDALGIRLFDPDFYAPAGYATLVTTPDRVPDQGTVTLAEARAQLGIA